MKLTRASLVLAAPLTALLAVATPAVSASAAPAVTHAAKLPCHTWVSNSLFTYCFRKPCAIASNRAAACWCHLDRASSLA